MILAYLLLVSLAWGDDPIHKPITSLEVPEEEICRAALIVDFPCYTLPELVAPNKAKCELYWAGEPYQCLVTLNARVAPLTVFVDLKYQEVPWGKKDKLTAWTIHDDRGVVYPLHSIETIKLPPMSK